MRVLVTGSNGQLGHDMLLCLNDNNIECQGIDKVDLDLSNRAATSKFIQNYCPDVLIHCAAFTNVDLAEQEFENCFASNVEATANIALQCKQIGSKMVYISTDYIFSGEEMKPYDTDDLPNPLSVYGRTKLLGEKKVIEHVDEHFIVRTSWAFGKNGNNFVDTMLRLGREKDVVDVVCDQIGSPTYTKDLARFISELIKTSKYGVYHATNEGYCSWAEFAEEIFKQAGLKTKVNHITSDQYPTIVKRPKNSMLSKSSIEKFDFQRFPKWEEALNRYLIEVGFIQFDENNY